MERHRIFLFAGAALLLISMPLVAFRVNWFGEMDSWHGAFMWLMSATLLFNSGVNPHPLAFVALIAAVLNIPQLIFPFLSNAERGTSKLFIWSFSISAVILVPMLAILIILNEHRQNSLREGYFVYQTGYILSAIGFYLKRKVYLNRDSPDPT